MITRYRNRQEVEILSSNKKELTQLTQSNFFCYELVKYNLNNLIFSLTIQTLQPAEIKKRKSCVITILADTDIVSQFEFCRLHIGETRTIPEGIKRNYPIEIDFSRLTERVVGLISELMPIIKGEVRSSFRDDALKAIKEHGKARSRTTNTLMQRFENFQVMILFFIIIY